ncbi:acyltransferase [Bacteroidia bacterium]|nr:acyltransferase [Bacteroidia bacterium]
MSEIKKHYVWVDYAKFLSIFLVVYFHCPPRLEGFYGILLGLIRMPCFYFISGLLFKFEKYPSFTGFAKHRSKQLLIPYFCFFILFYIYWLVIGKESDGNVPLYQPAWEYLYGRPNLICTPLWFISCLFALQCLFYGFCKIFKRRLYIVIVSFVASLIPLFVDLSNAPWMLDNVCAALPFYSIASLYKKEIFRLIDQKKSLIYSFFSLIVFLCIVFMLKSSLIRYLDYLLRLTGSFCILFPVFVVAKYLSNLFGKIRAIEYIALNAIIVLALHTYMIHIITLFISDKNLLEENFVKFLMAVTIVVCMMVPIYLINKYVPFIIGKRK